MGSPSVEDTGDVTLVSLPLSKAVHARRAEYTRSQQVRIKIGSWNVGASPGTDKDLASWFVGGCGIDRDLAQLDISPNPAIEYVGTEADGGNDAESVKLVGGEDIGLYVLGLQEIVDLNMTREYMSRALYTDKSAVVKWESALKDALPPGYEIVSTEYMFGLALFICASPEVQKTISNISSRQVGTGLFLGYGQNKGAVVTRIVLGETTRLVFVNSHLASGAGDSAVDRRCWDAAQITSKARFSPIEHNGVVEDNEDKLGDEEFAFWFGDLNFRLDGLPSDDVRRILILHAQGEYNLTSGKQPAPPEGEGVMVVAGSSSDDDTTTATSTHSRAQSYDSESSLPDPDDFPEDPSQDPTSLQATLDSLLPHDQLRKVITQRKAFHDGWREGDINFLPTYKYDIGTVGLFDSSEKRRMPSWCDRILFRTRRDREAYERRVEDEKAAKKKDEEMKSRGLEDDDDVLFSYDPDTDGDEAHKTSSTMEYNEYTENAQDGEALPYEDDGSLRLQVYTSHQRITSSDHKPIVSVFQLQYEGVDTEEKHKIHQQVARELDRAENESRPEITIIVEGAKEGGATSINFGEIAFREPKLSIMTIANTGSVAANVSFVDPPSGGDDESENLKYVKTRFELPEEGLSGPERRQVSLEPGDTVLAIMEAHVWSIGHARSLNSSETTLDTVLVLRVENGPDHFVTLQGTWTPTCFGRSVDELIRIPSGGIRALTKKKAIKGSIPYDLDVHHSAPRELTKLTDALSTMAERCMADDAMLDEVTLPSEPGWPLDSRKHTIPQVTLRELETELIRALDTDSRIVESMPLELPSSFKMEAIAHVLMLFLESLTDGIIPAHLSAKLSTTFPNLSLLAPSAWPDTRSQILDLLSSSPNHNISFVFLTATLASVTAELSAITAESKSPALARRLSFRRGGGRDDAHVKRRTREIKYAELLAPVTFQGEERQKTSKERDRERALLEMFLRRDEDS